MRIVMMGTGTFAEPSFAAALAAFPGEVVGLVTQPDRSTGRKGGATRQTGIGMAQLAESAGIPVLQPDNINTPESVAALRELRPDVLLVAAYGQILRKAIRETPTLDAINVHASLLPKYRGASPIAHAILNGETESGVTIIRIRAGLDSGEMLAQQSVPILEHDTTGELEARLAPMGGELAVRVIRQLADRSANAVSQDDNAVSLAPKLSKEMGNIDWALSSAKIAAHIRAMQPWPTAYTFFHRPGKPPMRMILLKSTSDNALSQANEPGTILSDSPLTVATGSGTLHIHELQPAGKKRMTADELMRGYKLQEGFRFGPEHSS